ncbi:BatD family protein, partial [bacterium]|nr:BatD family protein [bacterium]
MVAIFNRGPAPRRQGFAAANGPLAGFLFLFVIICLRTAIPQSADQLLMTLKVESSTIRWQEDFLLTLEIYGVPSEKPPVVTIEGLDQFRLNSQGKNLLQVPGGQTVKWILTYNLTALQDGTFKLGPARARIAGRTYSSNTLFVTVEGGGGKKPAQPEVQVPLVRSAEEIGNKILILAETNLVNPYKNQGMVVTYRLLSQLPVDSLRFTAEAEFPGFLKYDYPYVSRPRADRVRHREDWYVSYDLQRFLIFPLHEGSALLAPANCELKVRVPSGKFAAADLLLDAARSSNPLMVKIKPLPQPALVGNFILKNELVSDGARSKVVRIALEGDGLLSTFEFPPPLAPGAQVRVAAGSVTATLRGQKLFSRKTAEFDIAPDGNTINVVLHPFQVAQFDPDRNSVTVLTLPALSLRFSPQTASKPAPIPFPLSTTPVSAAAALPPALTCMLLFLRLY